MLKSPTISALSTLTIGLRGNLQILLENLYMALGVYTQVSQRQEIGQIYFAYLAV